MRTRIELSEDEVKQLLLRMFGAPVDHEKPLRVDSLMLIPGYGLEADITDNPLLPVVELPNGHREMQQALDAGSGVTVTTADDDVMF